MSKYLGEKIRKHRKEKGLSLEKLAKLSETSKSYIWELENRNTVNPTTNKLAKISRALGVTSDYLTNNEKLSDIVLEKAFFRKFNQLKKEDKRKIKQIVELWSKKN